MNVHGEIAVVTADLIAMDLGCRNLLKGFVAPWLWFAVAVNALFERNGLISVIGGNASTMNGRIHVAVTRLRSLGVPRDQTEEWLGHAVPGNHGIYMHMDQDWLVECKTKTDELIIELDGLCNRALNSADFSESTRTLRAPLGKRHLRLI